MKELSIDLKKVKAAALIILILPTLFFLLGWVKLIFAVPFSLILIASLILAVRKDDDSRKLTISIREIIAVALIMVAWCILTGIGGFTASKNDIFWRNPIYGDLIFKEWPVHYDGSLKGLSLSYYMGYWLVPASFAKLFVPLGEDAAWNAGRISLVIWTALLLFICSLLLKAYTSAKSSKQMLVMLLIFIFFSDMDSIALGIQTVLDNNSEMTFNRNRIFELMTGCWQYSSMTTQLGWVFNQSLPIWIATLLFINEKTAKNYALIGLSTLITSPLPLIGLVIFMLSYAGRDLYRSYKAGKAKEGLMNILSLSNILAFIAIFPPVALYITSNKAGGSFEFGLSYAMIHWKSFLSFLIASHIITVLLLFRKKRLFECILLLISFLFIPLIFLGRSASDIVNYPYEQASYSDFCMRVSIPAIVILMTMVIKFLFEEYNIKNDLRSLILTLVLILSLMAPVGEFYQCIAGTIDPDKRAFFYPYDKSEISLEDMKMTDLFPFDSEGNPMKDQSNFVCNSEESNFNKYLARR